MACFEGTRTFRSTEVSADVGSQNTASLVEVHPAFSGSALTASTENSQTSVRTKNGSASVAQRASKTSQARHSQESRSKEPKEKSAESDLQSAIIIGSIHGSAGNEPFVHALFFKYLFIC